MDLGAAMTLTSRRAQVETVLYRHGKLTPHSQHGLLGPCSECDNQAGLLDNLLIVLDPTPSWEELESILKESGLHPGDNCRKNLYERLMAWAEGTEPTPTWCGHWEHLQGGAWRLVGADPGLLSSYACRDWDICPVAGCRAPRPGAG